MPASLVAASAAGEESPIRQSLDDAWWTGPLLAASPATLPQGHFLAEPSLFDSIVDERFDNTGARQRTEQQSNFGSLTFLLYGLTDTTTIGVVPRFGYDHPNAGQSGSAVAVGDVTVQAAFRLAKFLDAGWLPAMCVLVAETLPTGRYDRLGARPSNGLGVGAYTTALAIYSQYYLWMPNGRLLRTRLDLTHSWSQGVSINDVSVYGTPAGFRGRASPGDSSVIDSAWEYSVTRRWVAALDVVYESDGSTLIAGQYPQPRTEGIGLVGLQFASGSSRSLALAPAVEYNWTSNAGVIAGAKVIAFGRNTSAAVIPAVAINLVF